MPLLAGNGNSVTDRKLVLYVQSTTKKKNELRKNYTPGIKVKGVSGFCLFAVIVLDNAITIVDSQWEFRNIDRNIGSLRPVNREEKKD